MGTIELQKEIKRLLGKLKWSQKRLGRELYYEKHPEENDNDKKEMRRFEEKAKKDLLRKSTKPLVLETYLELIAAHHEFRNLDIVVPVYRKSGILSADMEKEMKEVSHYISELVSK